MATKMIKTVFILSMLTIGLSACSTQPTVVDGWKIETSAAGNEYEPFNPLFVTEATRSRLRGVHKPNRKNVFVLLLEQKKDGTWEPSLDADTRRLGVEALWLDGPLKTVGLATLGTSSDSAHTAKNVCEMDKARNRSVLGFYSLCNSYFRKEIHDIGVIFKPLRVVPGMDIRAFDVDAKKVAAALENIDLDAVYKTALAHEVQIQNKIKAVADQYRNKQIAKAELAQQKFKQRDKQIEAFRQKLSRGDQTQCGYVIVVEQPLAQVQLPS
jgi:hypothetical protein